MRKKIKILSKFIIDCFRAIFEKAEVIYVVENANWSIFHDGLNLKRTIKKIKVSLYVFPNFIRNKIIHFGSINTMISNGEMKKVHKSNIVIVTWFHIAENDYRVNMISEVKPFVHQWHTSCYLTKEKLVSYGIESSKIIIIPLGVDTSKYYPYSDSKRKSLKRKFGIPSDKIIIGSFQKDGVGWEEGLEPKLIKGPDIFCDVIEKISKTYEIFVVLTGPGRGYVKKRLEKIGVPYHHKFLENPDHLMEYYNLLDVYLICSREEGGPKGVIESLATGVPLITSRVGMAHDLIKNNLNGFIVEVGDVVSYINSFEELTKNKNKVNMIIKNGYETILDYSLEKISNNYYEQIYKKFIKKTGKTGVKNEN